MKKSHPALGIFFSSMSLLSFEMLLIRLVSILLYPIATYLVISLALLGYGIGGTLIAIRRSPAELKPQHAGWTITVFSAATLISLVCIWFASTSSFLAFSLPFLLCFVFILGGVTITILFRQKGTSVNRLYFADMLGGSIGAGLTLLGLSFLSGLQVGVLVSASGLLAAWAFSEHSTLKRLALGGAVLLTGFGLLLPFSKGILPLVPKELALFEGLGEEVDWEYQGWNPLARIDVLSIPGDSLSTSQTVLYKLVTQDGGAPTLLLSAEPEAMAYIAEKTVFGLPYWIKPNPEQVFIIGLGGGIDLQTALYFNAQAVTAVEINARMLDLTRTEYNDFTGNLITNPRVTTIQGDGRHVIQASSQEFDIVQLTGVDTTVASPGANPNLAENYLYTVEAFREYYTHLTPQGLISLSFPKVDGLSQRLVGITWEALRAEGVGDPSSQIIVSQTGGYIHLLVKHSPFSSQEIEILKTRLEGSEGVYMPLYQRLFGNAYDPANGFLYAPGQAADSPISDLMDAYSRGLSSEWAAAQSRNIQPTTDDRPFFFVFDKWGVYAPNMEALVLSLELLGLATLIFLVLPLLLQRKHGLSFRLALPPALYFLLLGAAFIAVEVSLIQKLSLFVGHPSYALAVTISTMLAASGTGSLVSGRWKIAESKKVMLAIAGIMILIGGVMSVMPIFIDHLLSLPFALRVLITIFIVACPSFCMGIPFPAGLAMIKERYPVFVPWAWALNSGATVIGTLGSLLIAMTLGFQAVFVLAIGLYLAAGLLFLIFSKPDSRSPDGVDQ